MKQNFQLNLILVLYVLHNALSMKNVIDKERIMSLLHLYQKWMKNLQLFYCRLASVYGYKLLVLDKHWSYFNMCLNMIFVAFLLVCQDCRSCAFGSVTVCAVTVCATWLWWPTWPGFKAQPGRIIWVRFIASYALRLKSWAGTEGSTVYSLNCDCWLIQGTETFSISCCLNHW